MACHLKERRKKCLKRTLGERSVSKEVMVIQYGGKKKKKKFAMSYTRLEHLLYGEISQSDFASKWFNAWPANLASLF